MKKIINISLILIAIVLFVDFFSFAYWIMRNQTPVDGIYFGMITGNIIKLII